MAGNQRMHWLGRPEDRQRLAFLCLPGQPFGAAVFAPLAAALAPEHPVCVHPGAWPPVRSDADADADADGARVLEQCGSETVVLVAQGHAAPDAVALARRCPDRIAGLVVLGPPSGGLAAAAPIAAWLRAVTESQAFDRLVPEDLFVLYRRRAGEGVQRLDAALVDRLEDEVDGARIGELRAALEPPATGPAPATTERCPVPVLLVAGDRDQCLVEAEASRWLQARFGDCRTVLLPGVGHLALLESVDIVASIVSTFARELFASWPDRR